MELTSMANPTATTAPPSAKPEIEERLPPSPRQGLSRRTQVAMLGVLAIFGGVIYVVGPAIREKITPRTEALGSAPASAADATFKPTDTQWASFKIAPVTLRPFRTAQETDGKIALDDDRTTAVFSPYSGRVAKLFAKAGDSVQAGAPLMAIEASEFVQGQNDLISAVAALNVARAQLRLTQTNEKRQHDLYAANAGALKDWQQSQVDLATAQGGLNSAGIALGAVRNRLRILGKTDKEIAQLEAGENAQSFSPSSVVVAPISGTVTQRQVGIGQYIVNQASGGSNPVFSIGDLAHVWLVAHVPESEAPLVHMGDPVEVKVLAIPERVFAAKIVYVAPTIDPNTHRLLVHAEIDNPDGVLKPEMFARFSIITGQAVQAPGIPESAIVYEGDAARVFVADPAAKTISIRPIRVGRVVDGSVEVRDGLKPGESIVTRGSLFIDRAIQGD